MHKYNTFIPVGTEVGACRRNAPNCNKEGVMGRFDHLHKTFREQRLKARANQSLASSRPVVAVNGNGTSGYRIKQGPNKDKVAGHMSVIHQNSKI